MRRTRRSAAAEMDLDTPVSSPTKVEVRTPKSTKTSAARTPNHDEENMSQHRVASPTEIQESTDTEIKRSTIAMKSNAVHSIRDPNLTLESCVQRLSIVEDEKRELEQYVASISIESKMKLEASLEELKSGLDQKLHELSDKLQHVFKPDVSGQGRGKKRSDGKNMYRKSFVPEESLLSKMLHYDDENYKTIFNIMICVLILWGSSLAFDDILSQGLVDLNLLKWGVFDDLPCFLQSWVLMLVVFLLSTFYISHFAATATNMASYSLIILVYIAFHLAAFGYSTWIVRLRATQFSMPLAMGFMAEQTRMSMKMHSYLREKVAWKKYDGQLSAAPQSHGHAFGYGLPAPRYLYSELEKLFYFMFVPTLVYRDSYPRTSRIRWSFVIKRGMEFLGLIYFSFLLFRQALPQFEQTAGDPLTWNVFIRSSFNCMGPAMAAMVFTHFLVLHVVQNIGAELTRFADRKFYEDWWNSRTFSVFYRKWNGVVHDWIHSYLYTDLVEFCGFGKVTALLSAFFISAIIHEYLICIAMGFFCPILGILFTGPGLIFIMLTKNKTGRIWNIFMWLMLAAGNSWLMVLYSKEFYMRVQGPRDYFVTGQPYTDLGIYDFLVPRMFRVQFPSQFQASA